MAEQKSQEEFEIRKMTEADLDQVRDLFNEFWIEGIIKFLPNATVERLWETLHTYVSNPNFVCFLGTHEQKVCGVIIGAIIPAPYHSGLAAEEFIWFVTKEYRSKKIGMQLFETFEKEAKNLGCKSIAMAHMLNINPEKVEQIYRAKGYIPTEVKYTKLINQD